MIDRVKGWWHARSTRERVHLVLLLMAISGAIAHQSVVWYWYIEDSAISFSYARNLAFGDGLVVRPGGERLEGYSNPLWVFVLAVLQLVGWSPFSASKVLGLVFAGLTVPVTYLAAREGVRRDSDAPLFAALALAGNSMFAIWGGSGLENALFNLLMASALWRMFVEARHGADGTERFPLSAVLWLGLSLTRPEAILYAAIGGFASMVLALRDGRGILPTLRWLAAYWIPFGLYHTARYSYFAYEFPQTYYAKLGDHKEPAPMLWAGRGWGYVRNWAYAIGHGYLLPVYVIGLTGARGRRALLGLVLPFVWAVTAHLVAGDQRLLMPTVLIFVYLVYLGLIRTQEGEPRPALAVVGLLMVGAFVGSAEYMRSRGYASQVDHPLWTMTVPPFAAAAVAVLTPLLAWKVEGARVRVVCWALMVAGVGYAVGVHGDWMKGWRWMNLIAVPGSILLGLGIEATARLAQGVLLERQTRTQWAYAAAAALVLAPVPANVLFTYEFAKAPVTGPYGVYNRVKYKDRVKDRLHWYGPVVDLDVDMGAHLFWATDHRMLDIAGLVDVPFAQHRFQRDFVREYVFVEHRPLFAHIHGGWATNSRIPTHPEWKDQYYEIPGYPAGENYHIGNFLRRDAVFAEQFETPENRRVMFDDQIEMVGWRVPSPQVAPNRKLYLEVAFQAHKELPVGFRILGFLADPAGDRVFSFDLAPAYDWIPTEDWRRDEIFVGKFSPVLPEDLPLGTYDLGFALVLEGGRVLEAAPDYDPDEPGRIGLAPRAVLGGVGPWEARLMAGEVRFPSVFEVVPEGRMITESVQDHDRALEAAAAGDCEEAIDWWHQSRAHRPKASQWIDEVRPEVDRAIADCFVALAADQPEQAYELLRTARHWDWSSPALANAVEPIAQALYEQGMAARDAEDHETAYDRFSAAVELQPSLAWARRYAEESRNVRLRIDQGSKTNYQDRLQAEKRAKLRNSRGVEP